MDILVVDDLKSIQQLLNVFLEDAGYSVATAGNGQEALTYLRETTDLPRLILSDVAMPIMTGWDFLREQQRDARLAAIPVVLMTALGCFEHTEAADGAAAYLDKPIDLTALAAILRTYAPPRLRAREVIV
jgi:CheY-like chemotaxis protein